MDGDASRWRAHVKSTKIPEVLALLLDAGLRFFKCATLREARVLLDCARKHGVQIDLLVAYPLRSPALEELAALRRHFGEATVGVLCEDPLLQIDEGLGVFVDLNCGMNRSGVPMKDREAILACIEAAGSRFRGIHFYEGQLHSGDFATRKAAAHPLYDALLELCDELSADGHEIGEIVTSGTPGFRAALDHPGLAAPSCGALHRVSPGTVVYHDQRSDETCDELDLQPAALVFSRVVSLPAPDLATCDAGSKALAAEAGSPVAVALGHPQLEAGIPSEEHLPFHCAADAQPDRGSELYLVPRHVCPTVNLAEAALFIDGGDTRRVEVSARAHDL